GQRVGRREELDGRLQEALRELDDEEHGGDEDRECECGGSTRMAGVPLAEARPDEREQGGDGSGADPRSGRDGHAGGVYPGPPSGGRSAARGQPPSAVANRLSAPKRATDSFRTCASSSPSR